MISLAEELGSRLEAADGEEDGAKKTRKPASAFRKAKPHRALRFAQYSQY
jgi:hypothetical protein